MNVFTPFRRSPLPLSKIQRNPHWHLSRARHWENRLFDIMLWSKPLNASREACLHSLMLRVNRVKGAAEFAIFISQNEEAYYV